MSARREIADDAWGVVPDWIDALVKACDAKGASQNKVAGRLGYSGSVVSQVLRKDYAGDMHRLETRVRDIFLGGEITCPALGEIKSEACLKWRDLAADLTSASPIRVRMFNACKRCDRNQQAEEEDMT